MVIERVNGSMPALAKKGKHATPRNFWKIQKKIVQRRRTILDRSVDFKGGGVNSGKICVVWDGEGEEVPDLLAPGEDAGRSIVEGSLSLGLVGPASLGGVQETVSGTSEGGRENDDGVRGGNSGHEFDVGVGTVDVGDTGVNKNGKAVAIEDTDSLFDLGRELSTKNEYPREKKKRHRP